MSVKSSLPPQHSRSSTLNNAAEQRTVPNHIGIIMDGNGRWAQARNLPRTVGHKAGLDNLQRVLKACVEHGVKILSVYAFSTENWRRPAEEVAGMMRLVSIGIQRDLAELHRNGVKIVHSGRMEELTPSIRRHLTRAVEVTRYNSRITLNVAVNYGGRREIVDALTRMIQDGVDPEEITQDTFKRYLYVADLPDIDFVIRTGGENRLSNFLVWQSAHAEYYSTATYWPDFDELELSRSLESYRARFSCTDDAVDQAPAICEQPHVAQVLYLPAALPPSPRFATNSARICEIAA